MTRYVSYVACIRLVMNLITYLNVHISMSDRSIWRLCSVAELFSHVFLELNGAVSLRRSL